MGLCVCMLFEPHKAEMAHLKLQAEELEATILEKEEASRIESKISEFCAHL